MASGLLPPHPQLHHPLLPHASPCWTANRGRKHQPGRAVSGVAAGRPTGGFVAGDGAGAGHAATTSPVSCQFPPLHTATQRGLPGPPLARPAHPHRWHRHRAGDTRTHTCGQTSGHAHRGAWGCEAPHAGAGAPTAEAPMVATCVPQPAPAVVPWGPPTPAWRESAPREVAPAQRPRGSDLPNPRAGRAHHWGLGAAPVAAGAAGAGGSVRLSPPPLPSPRTLVFFLFQFSG